MAIEARKAPMEGGLANTGFDMMGGEWPNSNVNQIPPKKTRVTAKTWTINSETTIEVKSNLKFIGLRITFSFNEEII